MVNVALTCAFIFGALVASAFCWLSITRLRVAAPTDKIALSKNGLRLVLHSGLLLLAMRGLSLVWLESSSTDHTCEWYAETQQFSEWYRENCVPSSVDIIVALLLKEFLAAIGWVVPLLFASVGVSAYSSALMLPRDNHDRDEMEKIAQMPPFLRSIAAWLINRMR